MFCHIWSNITTSLHSQLLSRLPFTEPHVNAVPPTVYYPMIFDVFLMLFLHDVRAGTLLINFFIFW